MALPTKLSKGSLVARSVTEKIGRIRRPSVTTNAIVATPTPAAAANVDELSQQETAILMKHMSLILVHLRARIRFEIGQRGRVINRALPNSSFLDDARMVCSMGSEEELLYLLEQTSLETLAGIVKLAFQTHNEPILEAHVCQPIFALFSEAATKCDEVDVDDLRNVLISLPGVKIDFLGQLMAILAVEDAEREIQALAYAFSPAVFLPRFYGGRTETEEMARYKRHGFDAATWPQMAVIVTKYMIQNCDEIFGLDDEDIVERLAVKLGERKQAQSVASSYSTANEQNTCSGLFAANTSAAAVASSKLEQITANLPTSSSCRANFSFKAKNPWELTVQMGEELEVLERGKDAWWEVRSKEGKVGLVPESFVAPAPRQPTSCAASEEEQREEEDIEVQIKLALKEMQKLLRVKDRKQKRKADATVAQLLDQNATLNVQTAVAPANSRAFEAVD